MTTTPYKKPYISALHVKCLSIFRKVFPRKTLIVKDYGANNEFVCDSTPEGNCIVVKFCGSNNKVRIDEWCHFYGSGNIIFIQGNDNTVTIGKNTTFDQKVVLVVAEGTGITIGEDCQFAAGVTLRTSDQHPIYSKGMRINKAADIKIGSHVWLGAHTVVMKGVEIGAGAVTGYGALVTKSLPENCVAVGIPAQIKQTGIEWKRTFKEK